jgi:hypothetical protein
MPMSMPMPNVIMPTIPFTVIADAVADALPWLGERRGLT